MKRTRQLGIIFLVFAMGASILMLSLVFPALAQAQDASQQLHLKGLSRQPIRAALFDPNDAVLLLLDHQTGLFQTVNDIPVSELHANLVARAKLARQPGIPIVYTTSEPDGPNGPLTEELPKAVPSAVYVGRRGEVSCCDNADFVKAVKANGRNTLVIADVLTSVCVAFPALQAHADGFRGEEDIKGRITPGRLADFATLSADYMSISEEQIKNLEAVLTVLDGDMVYAVTPFETSAPTALPPMIPDWSPIAHFGGYQNAEQTADWCTPSPIAVGHCFRRSI